MSWGGDNGARILRAEDDRAAMSGRLFLRPSFRPNYFRRQIFFRY
ncbi:hypothetical protein SEA_POUND_222 [Mycobacterium phage Pound]|nr:hypothetical protein SEA_KALAH2_223 [Mycobacterium phage Kalah2]QQM15390.1 hypothetical protein SEA_POUND_222 [Mycobacterium phage Pound]